MQNYDAIILGGGLAGISCALELIHEHQTNFMLLESSGQLGGQLPLIKFTIRDLGGAFYKNGQDLLDSVNYSVEKFAVPYKTNVAVTRVDLSKKQVFTNAGDFEARTIVIATGLRTRLLDVKAEANLLQEIIYWVEGREEDVWNTNVTVIGGGDYATIEALGAAQHGSKVTLVNRGPLRARPDLTEDTKNNPNMKLLLGYEVSAIKGSQNIESVEVTNQKSGEVIAIPTNRLVVKIGSMPNTELFEDELSLGSGGYITVGKDMQTAIPGVYAIGDVTDARYLRLGTAVGGGVTAAHELLRHYVRA
jgi:thioredoxin reductase (NADPH)